MLNFRIVFSCTPRVFSVGKRDDGQMSYLTKDKSAFPVERGGCPGVECLLACLLAFLLAFFFLCLFIFERETEGERQRLS